MLTKEKIQEIEQQLNKEPTLHFRNIKDNNIPSRKKLVDWLDWLINFGVVAYTTYGSNGDIQCEPNCARSFSDLHRITQHYKTCTLEELLIALVELTKNNKIKTIFCGNIQKKVWFLFDRGWGNYGGRISKEGEYNKDEYGFTHNDYINYYNEFQKQLNGKEETIKEEKTADTLSF